MPSPGKVRQVIAYLLSNSIDAINSGGVIRIRVGAALVIGGSAAGLRITVGFGARHSSVGAVGTLRAVFTTKESVVAALGFWVCSNIVERHRGDFAADGVRTRV